MNKPVVVEPSCRYSAGSSVVAEAIQNGAVMSVINAAEVSGKLADAEVPEQVAHEIIVGLGLDN
jgi:PIN domain nuclease of toxin-antitoxin system